MNDAGTPTQRPSPFDAFANEKKIITFFGFPLDRNQTNVKVVAKGATSLIISFTLIFSMLANIIDKKDNIPIILETLYFGLTQTTFLCKIVNFLIRKESYYKLEDFLRKPIFNTFTVEQDVFIEEAIALSNFFAKSFRNVVALTILFYCVFPFLEKGLPLPGWFPVDEKKYHLFLYVYQIVAIILNGFIHSSLDCVTAAHISLASAQFEILKHNLEHLKRDEDDNLSEEELNVVIRVRVRDSVDHHNEIIKFVQQIEDMYSYVIFVQFLCSTIIICVTGFQIFVSNQTTMMKGLNDPSSFMPPSKLQYITLVLYLLCNLTQVSIFSWFGHDILIKSSGIADACYATEWNVTSATSRKLMFIIMERAKRPVILTAGKFVNLTLSTFMTILRTSYSYFAVLQQMYKKK